MKPSSGFLPAQLLLLVGVVETAGFVVKKAPAVTSAAAASRFGPKDCVLVQRSQSGSCVIKTECTGQDTSSLNFAFDCWSVDGNIFRHSYGKGGFDDQEEFNTEVQCEQCHPPSDDAEPSKSVPTLSMPAPPLSEPTPPPAQAPKSVSLAKTQAAQHPLEPVPLMTPLGRAKAVVTATEDSGAAHRSGPHVAGVMGDLASRRAAEEATVSRYGPNRCVSTWRSSEGHCILKTACDNVDISNYEIAMICVDEKGRKLRHKFGRGSFENFETFDTLAECSQCLGMDDQRVTALRAQRRHWAQSEEAAEVATLSEEVQTLTKGMTSMLSAVMKLRQKVEKKPTPSPEKKPTPSPAVMATLAAWRGEAPTSEMATPPAATSDAVPEAPAASTPQNQATAKVHATATKTFLKKRKDTTLAVVTSTKAGVGEQAELRRHKRHHRRKRKVDDDEDEDDEDYDDDDQESGDREDTVHHKKHKPQPEKEDSDWGEAVSTNDPFGETADAEAPELEMAEDGEAAAGMLDDGSSSLESTAW